MSIPNEVWIRGDGDGGVEFTNDKDAQAQRYVSAEQYDALAAHVERLSRLREWAEEEQIGSHILAGEFLAAMNDTPETSLARLKSQWREEAIKMRDDAVKQARREWASQASPAAQAERQVEVLGRLLAEVTFAAEAETVRAHIRNAMRRLRRQAEDQPHSAEDDV